MAGEATLEPVRNLLAPVATLPQGTRRRSRHMASIRWLRGSNPYSPWSVRLSGPADLSLISNSWDFAPRTSDGGA
jgi:hypothetical protein